MNAKCLYKPLWESVEEVFANIKVEAMLVVMICPVGLRESRIIESWSATKRKMISIKFNVLA